MTESAREMALEEATRSLSNQEDALNNLRVRSTTILSAGAIVFSVFTAQALGKHHLDVWIGFALVCFAVLTAASIFVLWPVTFVFRNKVGELLSEVADHNRPEDIEGIRYDWAYWAEENYDDNQKKIDCRTEVFTVGLAFLGLEVVFLGVALLVD